MVADKKIAWPAQLAIGVDGLGNSLEHVAQDHGSVDGVADPPLQAGHRGLPGAGRARCTSAIESPARRAGRARGLRRRHPARTGCTTGSPSFVNLQAIPAMAEGGLLADVIAGGASLDPVMGGCDR